MASVDELRQAAETLRQRAEASEPWAQNPEVGLALADLLDVLIEGFPNDTNLNRVSTAHRLASLVNEGAA